MSLTPGQSLAQDDDELDEQQERDRDGSPPPKRIKKQVDDLYSSSASSSSSSPLSSFISLPHISSSSSSSSSLSASSSSDSLRSALLQYFGFSSFREGQELTIRRILAGGRCCCCCCCLSFLFDTSSSCLPYSPDLRASFFFLFLLDRPLHSSHSRHRAGQVSLLSISRSVLAWLGACHLSSSVSDARSAVTFASLSAPCLGCLVLPVHPTAA